MAGYGPNGIYNSEGKCVRIEGSLRGVPNSRRIRPRLKQSFTPKPKRRGLGR